MFNLRTIAAAKLAVEQRCTVDLQSLGRETGVALCDCLLVIRRICTHSQVKAALTPRIHELERFFGISAVDRLARVLDPGAA